MIKYGSRIIHWIVLLFTGIALIGVNVTQFSCIHSQELYWQVKVVPAENDCPCDSDCACCCSKVCDYCSDNCHSRSHHAFYKVTDSSEVERVIPLEPLMSVMPGEICFTGDIFFIERLYFSIASKMPEQPPSPAWLCTFLC